MKYLKLLGLAAVAAMALMAFVGAGTASATGVLCSTATNPCTSKWAVGTVLDFSAETSTKLVDTENNSIDTCTGSTVKGKITANPGASGTTEGENTEITWTGCTFPTTTTVLGGLKIGSGGSGKGNVFATKEIKVKINTVLFGVCEYGVKAGTSLGTTSEGIGTAATFTANAVASKLNACIGPATAKWTGAYVLTSPNNTTFYVSTS